MSKVAGYFLVLSEVRHKAFRKRSQEYFAEPVVEFSHSRNVPLICFVMDDTGIISHIAFGRRGVVAGTGLRRLNVNDIYKLETLVLIDDIINQTSIRVSRHLFKKFKTGGLLPPKSFEEFLSVFLKEAPETEFVLSQYSKARRLRIEKLNKSARKSLAQQKEAVVTALNIAGIDKKEVKGWDYNEKTGPKSFLDGIEKVRLREDSMIINDLENFPGYNLIRNTRYSSSVFTKNDSQLTVVLANRLPLEELTGTDLIYYNEDFKCFVMVQYKVMEKESDQFLFRVPNNQLSEEIDRMDEILTMLYDYSKDESINDFRINSNPFFIKICPRIEFDPDNVGLSSGMYIPLDYLKLLQYDESIIGKRGGRAISYKNVGRYFDNTGFKTIIEGGWIGTNHNQSNQLEKIIRSVIENGRTAVIAVKKNISNQEGRQIDDDLIDDDLYD